MRTLLLSIIAVSFVFSGVAQNQNAGRQAAASHGGNYSSSKSSVSDNQNTVPVLTPSAHAVTGGNQPATNTVRAESPGGIAGKSAMNQGYRTPEVQGNQSIAGRGDWVNTGDDWSVEDYLFLLNRKTDTMTVRDFKTPCYLFSATGDPCLFSGFYGVSVSQFQDWGPAQRCLKRNQKRFSINGAVSMVALHNQYPFRVILGCFPSQEEAEIYCTMLQRYYAFCHVVRIS